MTVRADQVRHEFRVEHTSSHGLDRSRIRRTVETSAEIAPVLDSAAAAIRAGRACRSTRERLASRFPSRSARSADRDSGSISGRKVSHAPKRGKQRAIVGSDPILTDLLAFEFEKATFSLESVARRETSERPVGGDHPMGGNDRSEGVHSESETDAAPRPGRPGTSRKFAVRQKLAESDAAKLVVNAQKKSGESPSVASSTSNAADFPA
jgi:hypothetical protein